MAPQQSVETLRTAQAWLERNKRAIVVAVSLVFCVFLFCKGVAGLMD